MAKVLSETAGAGLPGLILRPAQTGDDQYRGATPVNGSNLEEPGARRRLRGAGHPTVVPVLRPPAKAGSVMDGVSQPAAVVTLTPAANRREQPSGSSGQVRARHRTQRGLQGLQRGGGGSLRRPHGRSDAEP